MDENVILEVSSVIISHKLSISSRPCCHFLSRRQVVYVHFGTCAELAQSPRYNLAELCNMRKCSQLCCILSNFFYLFDVFYPTEDKADFRDM